ncbi:MAG TPA: hypothetical protein VGK36_13380 [Candidatus Angelobacter sp.]|jgi:hypothetical protein
MPEEWSSEVYSKDGLQMALAIQFLDPVGMTFSDQILARRHRIAHIELFEIYAEELDQIERVAGTVGTDLQFTTFWFPIGIAAILTLIVVPIPNLRVFNIYLCVGVISLGFGIYFLIRWLRNRGELKHYLSRIRERQIGPVGEEGKELKPSDLAALPSVTPTSTPENQQ